jgi:hypothetical protein
MTTFDERTECSLSMTYMGEIDLCSRIDNFIASVFIDKDMITIVNYFSGMSSG